MFAGQVRVADCPRRVPGYNWNQNRQVDNRPRAAGKDVFSVLATLVLAVEGLGYQVNFS
jgi:hypothetical protein